MKRIYKLCLGLMMCIGLSHYSMAQTSLGSSKDLLSELKKGIGNSTTKISGTSIKLKVSASQSFDGQVNFKQSDANSEFLVGEIENVAGSSFYVKASTQSLEGHIILKATKKAYKYYSDKNGNAYVSEVPINSVVCIDYENRPKAKSNLKTEADVVAQQAVASLQSLPGAAGCVLLDFDGYNMPAGNLWNSGNAINAAASGMSAGDIQEFWEVVSEDYRPFNLNVTTDENVFNAYARTRRMRCVVTPTDVAAPHAGGVAYIGSFNWDNDVPCWVYVLGGKAGGDAASHEIGHTFGLNHDGRYINGDQNNIEEYFQGLQTPQTAWAPIMGAGYYEAVAQWSKGEYQYADNIAGVYAPHIGKNGDDDVAMIADPQWGVGYRGDDYGNDEGSAAAITYNASGAIDQKNGIIGSEADWDFFSFTTGGGNVSINANTVSRDGDLDIIIRLYNSSGTQIGSYTDDQLAHLNASMNVNLAAGKYFISIDGTGSGDPSTGGYSAYGSIGSYSITGTIPPAVATSTDGMAIVYKDCAYGGYAIGLNEGNYTRADILNKGISDDDISSIKVKEGFKIIVYKDDNYTGVSTTLTGNTDCLVNLGFNDVITSLQVVPNGITGMNGNYYLQNQNSSLYLDVPGAGLTDGIQLQQWTYNGSAAQQYSLTDLGGGVYKVLNLSSGKAMDVNAISTDDGAVVQQWTYLGSQNQQWILVASTAGYYKFIARHSAKVVEIAGYSTAAGGKTQQWTNVDQTSGHWKLIPVTAVVGTGNGLIGSYFNGMNFDTAKLNRKDATVNFDWGNGSPDASVNADAFSVRWTGQIQPKYSGVYTFYANTDNGRRLWINGQLIIDKWVDDWGTEYTGTITLTAGQLYDFKMEYFENYGGANAKLEWSSALQAREVIPQQQLYSPDVTNPHPGTTNTLPVASISSPGNNATFNAPANIVITASASDQDGSISKVEFFNGSQKIGESTSSPYTYSWTAVAAGNYSITVKATDNSGGSTTSSAVTVVVNIVAIDNCAGIAQYLENNGYNAGSVVKNAARKYECKEWPYSGWCNGAAWAYAPGSGSYWTDAWYDRGTCTATQSGGSSAAESNAELSISPNPVQGDLHLSYGSSFSGTSVMIIDVNGKMVYQSSASSEAINTSDINAGIYTLIFMTSDHQKITKRFVKIK